MTSEKGALLARARWSDLKESLMDDYLFIGGPRMPACLAAARLGVSKRTIERYRRALRDAGRLQ